MYVSPRTPLRLVGMTVGCGRSCLNLVGNGIKFTQKGGMTVAVDVVADNGPIARLRFEITDTGIGITYKAQEKIFESFVQADQSILDRFGGTGLGLSLARKSVELLGGKIGVDSAVGARKHVLVRT